MKKLLCLLFFIVGLANGQIIAPVVINSGNPKIALNISGQTDNCVAPCTKFMQAVGTTSPQTSRPFSDIFYSWDFGDITEFWTTGSGEGANNKNLAFGAVTAHVYKTAGVYKPCVTAFDGTNTNTVCAVVIVTAPDSVYSGNNTFCFDLVLPVSGNDGCPTGASVAIASDFCAAVNTYLTTGKRLLFRANATFNCASAANITVGGPWSIDSYGSGSRAIVDARSAIIFNIGNSTAGVYPRNGRIANVELTNTLPADTTQAIVGAGNFNNITFLNLYIHDLKDGYNIYPNNTCCNKSGNTSIWQEWAIVENTIQNINGGAATHGVYIFANQFALLGNLIDNTVSGEHLVRIEYCKYCAISNNTLSNGASAKESIGLRGVGQTAASYYFQYVLPAPSPTQYNVISNNKININAFAGLKIGPVNDTAVTVINNIIVESEYYYLSAAPLSQVNSLITLQASNSSIRNNVLNWTNATRNDGIELLGASTGMVAATNNQIFNNTLYSATDGNGNMSLIAASVGTTNNEVKNNLAYFPAETGSTNIKTGVGTITASNNSTDSSGTNQIKNTSPLFIGPLTIPAGFTPGTGSYAINGGASVPLWTDFYMQPRTGTYDIGALNP